MPNIENNVVVNFSGEKTELVPGQVYYIVKRADGPKGTYPFSLTISRNRTYDEALERAEHLTSETGHKFCVIELRVIVVSTPRYETRTIHFGEPL